jgi:hypothetical protein
MEEKWLCPECWWNSSENICLNDQKKIKYDGEFSAKSHSLSVGSVTACTGFTEKDK